MILRGNVAYGNQARGFELRVDTNSFVEFVNNTSVKNDDIRRLVCRHERHRPDLRHQQCVRL